MPKQRNVRRKVYRNTIGFTLCCPGHLLLGLGPALPVLNTAATSCFYCFLIYSCTVPKNDFFKDFGSKCVLRLH